MCAGSEGVACWFGDMVVDICIWKERSEAVCGINPKERLEKTSSETKLETKGVGKKGSFLGGVEGLTWLVRSLSSREQKQPMTQVEHYMICTFSSKNSPFWCLWSTYTWQLPPSAQQSSGCP